MAGSMQAKAQAAEVEKRAAAACAERRWRAPARTEEASGAPCGIAEQAILLGGTHACIIIAVRVHAAFGAFGWLPWGWLRSTRLP